MFMTVQSLQMSWKAFQSLWMMMAPSNRLPQFMLTGDMTVRPLEAI